MKRLVLRVVRAHRIRDRVYKPGELITFSDDAERGWFLATLGWSAFRPEFQDVSGDQAAQEALAQSEAAKVIAIERATALQEENHALRGRVMALEDRLSPSQMGRLDLTTNQIVPPLPTLPAEPGATPLSPAPSFDALVDLLAALDEPTLCRLPNLKPAAAAKLRQWATEQLASRTAEAGEG
jgi:hypothetical protein